MLPESLFSNFFSQCLEVEIKTRLMHSYQVVTLSITAVGRHCKGTSGFSEDYWEGQFLERSQYLVPSGTLIFAVDWLEG